MPLNRFDRTLIVLLATPLVSGCGREPVTAPSGADLARIDVPEQLIAYDLAAMVVTEDGSVQTKLRTSQPFVVKGRFISPDAIKEKVRITIIQPRGDKAATVGRNLAEIVADGRHQYRYECPIKGVRHSGLLVVRVTVGTELVDEATITVVE